MTNDQGALLLRLARQAIQTELGVARHGPPVDAASSELDWLKEPGASFVTLMRGERLRGCIGSIEPRRPLDEDVHENAVAAAMRDPRFWPMQPDELIDLRVEVTVLSPLEALPIRDEADALEKLRPGVDGLVLTCGSYKGTFIPQMWEQLPAPREFLRYLKQKSGLPGHAWDPRIELQRFTAEKWHE